MTTILDVPAMSPAEKLIVRKLFEAIEDGYDQGNAIIRVANELGLARERVLRAWIHNRLREDE